MEKTDSVITFENVTKNYGSLPILNSLSFEIREHDVVGVLGPSGVGKTTVLKLIADLTQPSSGTIKKISGRIGYVFQEPRLLPWRTAVDNVSLPLQAMGIRRQIARKNASGWLSRMGLDKFSDYYPAHLSGGMLQRISLARALALQPKILLMDEPFSALDVRLKEDMLSLIRAQLSEHPITVLYVSHIPDEVIMIATRIFLLAHNGDFKELPITDRSELLEKLKNACR
ncbi:MAG: ATP-binding cassette domain-containing protein [Candidatus Latescibacteria bacterium]|nr:ATP-binding cassette domain-containing protein [Candidatus Latescibacterota bacterium]